MSVVAEKPVAAEPQPPQPPGATNAVSGAATNTAAGATPEVKVSLSPAGPPSQTPISTQTDPAQPGTSAAKTNETSVGTIIDSKVSIDQRQDNRQYMFEVAQSRITYFSFEDPHEDVDHLDEINHSSNFVRDETFVSNVVATLRQHRFLLLAGDADSGKASMSRYLALRLQEDGHIRHNTRVYSPPGRNVKLPLPSALVNQENLHGRVVIFRDALELSNPDINSFLCSLKGEAVTSLTRGLNQIQSYLVLTSVYSDVPAECLAVMPEELRPRFKPPQPSLSLIEEHISLLTRNLNLDGATAQVSDEVKRTIAEHCKTIPRTVTFIKSQLIHVLRDKKPIAAALKDYDSLLSWFKKIEAKPEAWIYALASVLADPLSEKEGVPWAEFIVIYDAVRQRILRHRDTRRIERPFDEPSLQATAGIEVVRDRSFPRNLIRFKDSRDVESHWDTLLTKFPSLLTDLIPVFLKLTSHESPFVRSRAAQVLGRIGYLDANSISKPWLETWSMSESWRERSLVGYAAQGILSSGDQEYRDFLLDSLDRFTAERSQTWAAVAAYKQIGAIDLSLSMEKLHEIAKLKLAPAFEANLQINQRLQQLERKLTAAETSPTRVIVLLDEFYVELFENAEIAQTFKYALVSLSITTGAPSVLAHLSRWALGSRGMGALVSLVFLQKEGIADELTSRQQPLVSQPQRGGNKKNSSCNMILGSLIESPEAVQVLATFLEATYAAILDFFPPDTTALLNNLFFDYCKTWVREAQPIQGCRAAMVALVGRLLDSPLQALWQRTYDWLADPDFSHPKMVAFAKDARLLKR